ncbi:MAG: glycosyl hydrolase, partial [Rubricoccaceae bacterium]|nr:glycosyl hydrolase [Rubricoccaceae bacterium]
DPDHLVLGNDGGLYISYDEGANWLHVNNMPVGQFYTVNVDMEEPYNVYGGLQDNGVKMGSSRSVPNRTRHWETLLGGDGMFVLPDPRDHNLVYTGFQFGNYFRINRRNGEREGITPSDELGKPKLRWNWRTPVVMSSHNPDVLYMGAQRLFRSMDQGHNWENISDDLTRDLPQGNVPFSTITEISESKFRFGKVVVGTDDGKVWVTESAAVDNWTDISSGLPANKWVSSVEFSGHAENRIYLSLNGYRTDDFNTYVYRSDDKGKTWTSLQANLPKVVVNVIHEDPVNEDLLYVGTDHGVYASFDRGESFMLMGGQLTGDEHLPNAPVHDLKVHPRDSELIVGTHGRSIYVVDVSHLQLLTNELRGEVLHVFDTEDVRHSENWGARNNSWSEAREATIEFVYWAREGGEVAISIASEDGEVVYSMDDSAERGLNYVDYSLTANGPLTDTHEAGEDNHVYYLIPGDYTVSLTLNGTGVETTFSVNEPPPGPPRGRKKTP